MIYKIHKNLHNNFSVFEKNKLSPRAYSVPYTDKETLKNTEFTDERYASDIVEVL